MARSRDINRRDPSPEPTTGDAEGGPSRWKGSLWSVLAVLAFAAVVGLCCLCGGVFYQQWPTFHDDPATAEELAQQMVAIDVPETFQPKGTVEWHIWWFLTMRGVYYAHTVDDGELTLLEVDSQFLSQPEFRQHIVNSLHEQRAGSGFDLNVLQSETRSLTVQGEEVEFEFMEAEDRSTGEGRRLVDGVVSGREGRPVLVSLWLDEDIWDEEAVVRMIESIGGAP